MLRIEDIPENDRPASDERSSFSPIIKAELTGDRLEDVVAVLATGGPSPRYAVVAFHQMPSHRYSAPIWLVRDTKEKIVGVFTFDKRRVVPASCIHCDSDPFYRWNGEEYEVEYWLAGEQASVMAVSPLRADPSDDASEMVELKECVSVTIERALPRAGNARWYRVRAQTEKGTIRGFLKGSSLTWTGCIG